MNRTTLLTTFILFALIAPVLAGKKHKSGDKPPTSEQVISQVADSQLPSVRLAPFLGTPLDHIFAPLDQQVVLPNNELRMLRESFVDQGSAATDTNRAVYKSAVLVCDAMSSAMDEREKAIVGFQKASVKSTELGAHRIANPTREDLKRERHEEENKKNDAKQRDAENKSQLKANWTLHTLQLRKNIDLLSSRLHAAERAEEQAKAAAPQPAP